MTQYRVTDMHYFISSMLLIMTIHLPVNAQQSQTPQQKKDSAVPHNNGTQGLLKNTFIEPIENFNNISKDKETNKLSEKTPSEAQQKADQKVTEETL